MPELNNDLFNTLMSFDGFDKREKCIKAPLGWPGGKSESLKHILPLIPHGDTFIDACGGSGIITINSPDWFKQKVYNDRYGALTQFYKCLRDPIKMRLLSDKLKLYPHSREEFVFSRATWENDSDEVDRVAKWYFMLRCSFGQLGRNFGRATTGTNMIANKLSAGIELFPIIHDRFKGVLIENLDVCQCLTDFDSGGSVFYIDPPYMGTDPIYKHTVDHHKLLDTIFHLKGWVALSGYASRLYDVQNWDERYEWEVRTPITSGARNEESKLDGKENVMSKDTKNTEVLWIKEFK